MTSNAINYMRAKADSGLSNIRKIFAPIDTVLSSLGGPGTLLRGIGTVLNPFSKVRSSHFERNDK